MKRKCIELVMAMEGGLNYTDLVGMRISELFFINKEVALIIQKRNKK